MTTDERMKVLVAALERHPRINIHRHPIRVELAKDALSLEGEVENIAAKKLALELAGKVPGLSGIVDRLRIPRTTWMGDGEIRTHLRDALLQEPAFTDVSIQIQTDGETEILRRVDGDSYMLASVQEGVVTLNGQVMSLSHNWKGPYPTRCPKRQRSSMRGSSLVSTTSTPSSKCTHEGRTCTMMYARD